MNRGRKAGSKTDRSKPVYFEDGMILKIGGLAKLLGCGVDAAREIADTGGFPPQRIFKRGCKGWSRMEVMAWLRNPTAPPVDDEKRAGHAE